MSVHAINYSYLSVTGPHRTTPEADVEVKSIFISINEGLYVFDLNAILELPHPPQPGNRIVYCSGP